jgi:hypothetical protein
MVRRSTNGSMKTFVVIACVQPVNTISGVRPKVSQIPAVPEQGYCSVYSCVASTGFGTSSSCTAGSLRAAPNAGSFFMSVNCL